MVHILDALEYIKMYGVCYDINFPFNGKRTKDVPDPRDEKIFIDSYEVLTGVEMAKAYLSRNYIIGQFVVPTNSIFCLKGGVYNEQRQRDPFGTHGVLIFGMGREGGVEYFKVLNSWNESWGIGGIGKIACHLFTFFASPGLPYRSKPENRFQNSLKKRAIELGGAYRTWGLWKSGIDSLTMELKDDGFVSEAEPEHGMGEITNFVALIGLIALPVLLVLELCFIKQFVQDILCLLLKCTLSGVFHRVLTIMCHMISVEVWLTGPEQGMGEISNFMAQICCLTCSSCPGVRNYDNENGGKSYILQYRNFGRLVRCVKREILSKLNLIPQDTIKIQSPGAGATDGEDNRIHGHNRPYFPTWSPGSGVVLYPAVRPGYPVPVAEMYLFRGLPLPVDRYVPHAFHRVQANRAGAGDEGDNQINGPNKPCCPSCSSCLGVGLYPVHSGNPVPVVGIYPIRNRCVPSHIDRYVPQAFPRVQDNRNPRGAGRLLVALHHWEHK